MPSAGIHNLLLRINQSQAEGLHTANQPRVRAAQESRLAVAVQKNNRYWWQGLLPCTVIHLIVVKPIKKFAERDC